MAYKFNPFTGNLDLISNVTPTVQTPNYAETFDATTDWGAASGGFYSITILAATHGKGTNPIIQVYELNGADYELVELSVSINSGTGDIRIAVSEVPDNRFEGKIIISENN